jgi:hypothetical protein
MRKNPLPDAHGMATADDDLKKAASMMSEIHGINSSKQVLPLSELKFEYDVRNTWD